VPPALVTLVMSVDDSRTPVQVDVEHRGEVSILTVRGVLHSATYRGLRDAIIEAALDEPRAVVVDVNLLCVPAESAWAVFTSARRHVRTWPGVPIVLVCAHSWSRRAITAVGVDRYVPVHSTRESALDTVGNLSVRLRRRARTQLPAAAVSVQDGRAAVTDWLTKWSQSPLIPAACTVATVFIENVLAHTESAPVLIVETFGDSVTVAVEDCSHRPAIRRESGDRGTEIVSGLSIVSALAGEWGSTPTSSGKTVWAVVGRENSASE
jgi:hypothetical protein